MKLATKLSLIIVLITLGCGVATALLVSSYTMKTLERMIVDDVDIVVDTLAPHLSESLINQDLVATREILQGILSEKRGFDFAFLTDSNGKILVHTFGKELPRELLDKTAVKPIGDENHAFMHFDYQGRSYIVGAYPLLEGVKLGTVHVGINHTIFNADIHKLKILILSLSFSVAIAGIVIAIFSSLRLTRPLQQLTRSICAFGSGKTIFPVMVTGGMEINQLSMAFHEMVKSRNMADEALRESEEKHRLLFESAGDAIFIHDFAGHFHVVNRVACERLGYSHAELMSLPLGALDAPEENKHVPTRMAQMMEHGHLTFETVHQRKDGSFLSTEVSARVITWDGQQVVMSICRDLTKRKRDEQERLQLEKQLLHAQKLESLGVLAGGIAHDFNNILTSVMGNADLALMRLNPESPAVDNLRRIEQSAARAADLAKQMLAYSGKGKFVIEQLDVNRLVEEMLHMLEVSISKKAILRLNPHQSLPTVEADATQLRQIVMNLVINASEAIGDRSGVISITTGCMECDHNYLKDVWLDENLTEGSYVSLEIADNGCGMSRETLMKVFDPFFTTKFTGRGLGMAAVLGIVRGHKGAIKVYSEQNKGTTFKVLFPASSKPAESVDSERHPVEWQGCGTILLVDDEETVRAIGSEMLRELGFTVITADDGRHALEQFKAYSEIRLVILDLTMPHLDGEQAFRELRRINPQVKVIMSSGYNEYEVTHRFAGKGLSGFIQKPYKLSEFKEAIRNVC